VFYVKHLSCLFVPCLNIPPASGFQLKLVYKLESVQRQFTKRIPALQELSYRDRLSALNVESLEHRHLRLDLFMVALCNRADHNIFILFLLLSSSSFFLFFLA